METLTRLTVSGFRSIRGLIGPKGFFVSFDYSKDAPTEIDALFRKSGKIIIPLTVNEILNEEIARPAECDLLV